MKRLRRFLGLCGALALLNLAGTAQGAWHFVESVLETDQRGLLTLDCPSVDEALRSRFAALLQDLPELGELPELALLKDLSLQVLTTPQGLDSCVLAAEIREGVTEEQLGQIMKWSPLDLEALEEPLTALGTYDNGDLRFHAVLLVQGDRRYLLGASDPELLPVIAQAEVTQERPHRGDLWIRFIPFLGDQDQEGQNEGRPLVLELVLDETKQSLLAQMSYNLREILADQGIALAPEDQGQDRPPLLGAGPVYALLSLENSWIPADLTPQTVGLDDDRYSLEEALTALELLTGITWQEILDSLRAPASLSFQGELPLPLLGTLPRPVIQLGGASERMSRVIMGWLLTLGKPMGFSARALEPQDYNGWTGMAFGHPDVPNLEVLMGYKEGQGMAAAAATQGENPFQEGAAEMAPELQAALGRYPLAFSCDIGGLMERLRQVLALAQLLGQDAQELELFCAFLEPWKALTFQAGLDQMALELFFSAQESAQEPEPGQESQAQEDQPQGSPLQRMAQLLEPLEIFQEVGFDVDGEMMAQLDDVKIFLREVPQENRLLFYCGLTLSDWDESLRLRRAIDWSRSHPDTTLDVDLDDGDTIFWMSQSLSTETTPTDQELVDFATQYSDHLRALMELVDW